MIYLEVTTSSRSVRNTGIQRITRKIFQELSARVPVTPISWNKISRRFQRLSATELATLEAPFRVQSRPTSYPELKGENLLAELYRLAFRKTLRLECEMGPDDVFLAPDIYRDARTRIFPNLLSKSRARSIAIFHDAAALELPSLYSGAGPRFRSYIKSLAAFDCIICVSHSSHRDLQRLWAASSTKPTRTVVETWPLEFAEAERAGQAKPSRDLVVCVGSFEPRKNHLSLLRSAATLWQRGRSFELVLIGRSTAGFGWKVMTEIGRLQKKGYPLQWWRHVEDRVLHRAYRGCKFTVYPSLAEGFGLPIMESLWHGKPCICGGNGALGEAANEGGCLVVDQTSERGITDGMEKLLTDDAAYANLREQANAREFRSWSDYTNRLLKHLQGSKIEG
jgi:glycosyltransferase involved in cell wall biosynthesis